MAAIRGLSSLVLGYLAVSVLANPVPEAEPNPNPQVSLPPLIPSVPGFTDPIGTLAAPLLVLQVPTPAKPSSPFTGSDIKPKKIGYFWTAAGDNDHAGEWNTSCGRAEADSSDTFALGLTFLLSSLLYVEHLRYFPVVGRCSYKREQPPSSRVFKGWEDTGRGWLALSAEGAGNVMIRYHSHKPCLTLVTVQDTAFYFDVSNRYRPALKKSNGALTSVVTDEIRAKPDGLHCPHYFRFFTLLTAR